jgi:hypothetical protein
MPFAKNPWWVYVASFVPALLVTILIFMDQQISAVIVNRKENKLKVRRGQGHRGQGTQRSRSQRSRHPEVKEPFHWEFNPITPSL